MAVAVVAIGVVVVLFGNRLVEVVGCSCVGAVLVVAAGIAETVVVDAPVYVVRIRILREVGWELRAGFGGYKEVRYPVRFLSVLLTIVSHHGLQQWGNSRLFSLKGVCLRR